MHPNALQVDPKIVMQDTKFHKESDSAEDAFIAMEDKEVEEMHERFVVANGGKVPKDDEVGLVRKGSERVHAESTYILTKDLLLEGRKIKNIADVREVTEATIWNHIEKLVGDSQIVADDVQHLEPEDIVWGDAREVLYAAMDEHGTEKLKPIFEAANEKYDYTLVRLARVQYLLEGDGAGPVPF